MSWLKKLFRPKKTEKSNNTQVLQTVSPKKKLDSKMFKFKTDLLRYSKRISIFSGEDENGKGAISLSFSTTATEICCWYSDKTTKMDVHEWGIMHRYYFVLFEPEDFLELLRKTFTKYPFINKECSEEENLKLKEAFDALKELAGDLPDRLDALSPIRDPKNYQIIKRIGFSTKPFLNKYCPEAMADENKEVIYSNTDNWWQNKKKTVLVTVDKDNWFRLDSYLGNYDGNDITVVKFELDLPEDFYRYCFENNYKSSNQNEINQVFNMLPGIRKDTFTYNDAVKKIYEHLYSTKVLVSDNITLNVYNRLNRNENKLWITAEGKEKDPVTVSVEFLFSKDAAYLADYLISKYPEEIAGKKELLVKALQESETISGLFENADLYVTKGLNQEDAEKARDFARKGWAVTAYTDIHDGIIDRKGYDGVSGSAVNYNYIKANAGFSAREAVDQYLDVKNAYINLGLDRFKIGVYSLAQSFYYKETIIMVNDDNMRMSEEEKKEFIEKCRQNRIKVFQRTGDHYYEYVSENDYIIKYNDYPGSADDAATYCSIELMRIDHNNE